MKTVMFRGEVVSPQYDCDFFADWIDKGIVCPSSRMEAEFSAVSEDDEVNVFVDTPGGDVFAGDAIVIAALAAYKRCGGKLTVEIGSEACSMGAFFVAALKAAGAKVRCHANSKVMFHSASVSTEGGAEILKDRAALVEKINANVKANLAKLGIEDTDDWFAEGREKWLGSDDLKTLGLADEVLEEEVAKPDIADGVKAFRAAALKRAEANRDNGAQTLSAGSPAKPDTPAPAPAAKAVSPTANKDISSLAVNDTKNSDNWEARFKGASKKINELTAERDELKKRLDDLLAHAEADMADATRKFTDQLEAQKKDLAEANARVSELSAALEEKTKDLKAKADLLSEKDKAIAEANEHVSRLESARQLLTAGVLTPTSSLSYKERLDAEPTAEGRERLRAMKRAGKIK